MDQVLKSYLEYICGQNNVEENVLISTRTTFKIGGPAKFFVTVPSKESLIKLISALQYIEYPYRIIGLGANILASDSGFDGVIIKLGFREIVDNQCFIYADAGASLRAVAHFAKERGLTGLEWCAGIPATVGGAVHMNAGAHGGQISDSVVMVDVLQNGEIVTYNAKQCKFGYRTSVFARRRGLIIIGAYFSTKAGNKAEIESRETEILNKRRLTQPQEPSAGSVFRRPTAKQLQKAGLTEFFVGRAVEELGLKGLQSGGAAISEKHGGFIVNKGGATSADVLKLIRIIKKKVREKYGITLQTEIEIL